MVSEQIPLPATSAFVEKNGVECTESSSNGSIDPKSGIAEGWRLLSMDSSKNLQKGFKFAIIMLPVRSVFSYFYFLNSHSIHYKMCFYYCCSRLTSLSLSYFSIFAVEDHLEFQGNKYKPIWPQQQQKIIVLFVMIVVCRNFWQLVNIILHTMPPERCKEKM